MIVTGFTGTAPSANLLARIRTGEIGGVILFGDNVAGGDQASTALINELQSAAAQGKQPGLLIMTDQEGGEVKRLPGPPDYAASQMTTASLAGQQGLLTGQYLKAVGVNVDLAPVSDVDQAPTGFLATEDRTFGDTPSQVASRACAFAKGVADAGVAPTFKHFPGLGMAITSTDTAPVTVDASASLIRGDDLVYRVCANATATPALVMVSSAIYPALTGGDLPAVISPEIYNNELPKVDHVHVVTISDDLGAGALANIQTPAARAIDAGLDLLLYASNGAVSDYSYHVLLGEAEHEPPIQAKIQQAAAAILQLKRALHLST
jgi:beta-N-acetylhexosaminidase